MTQQQNNQPMTGCYKRLLRPRCGWTLIKNRTCVTEAKGGIHRFWDNISDVRISIWCKTRPGKWNRTWKWLEFGNHHPPCLCKFPSGMQVPFLFSLHVQRGFRGETGLLVLWETRKWHLVIAIFSNTPCKGNSDSRHHAVCQICCQDGWRPAFW